MNSSWESMRNGSTESRTDSKESRRSSQNNTLKIGINNLKESDYRGERSMEGRSREGEERNNMWHQSSPLNPRNFQILSSLLELM